MNKQAIQKLNHVLGGLEPRAPACVFLFTPDDGAGQPELVVQHRRLDPLVRLRLLRQGARAMVEGRVRKLDDGTLQFKAAQLNPRRLQNMVAALEAEVPFLASATLKA